MSKNKKEKRPFISKLIFVFLIIILFGIYARYIGSKGLKIYEYGVTSENLEENFDGFSIVQISDIKYGSTIFKDELKKIVNKINDLKPDIVVFTGDLVADEYKLSSSEEENIINLLASIDPLIGKYSIKGDKDYKGNIYANIMNKSDFTDLTNKSELIYYKGLTPIRIYGLGSLIKGKQDFDSTFKVEDDLTDLFDILLVHEPDTIDYVGNYDIDLMLSGHSLNGIINIPYVKNLYNIKGAEKYNNLEYEINETKLYVSSGLGTNYLKSRLFNKPSISIIRLYKK